MPNNSETEITEKAKTEEAAAEPAGKKAPAGPEYASLMRKGVFTRNPVLLRALAIAPVIVASQTLKNGLLLSVVTLIVLTVMGAASSLLYKRLPAFCRASVLTLVAAAVVTPLCMLAQLSVPNIAASVGIFLPLTAVNGIILSRAEDFGASEKLLPSIVDGAANGLGFSLAILVISAVREMLGYGLLYERPLPGLASNNLSFALLPAGGMVAMAVLIAAVQFARQRRRKNHR